MFTDILSIKNENDWSLAVSQRQRCSKTILCYSNSKKHKKYNTYYRWYFGNKLKISLWDEDVASLGA
jgi:hypothetical protein